LYTYNVDKELTMVKQPDLEIERYDYADSVCSCGRLASFIQSRGTNTYSYDFPAGNLTGVKAPGGIELGFDYDGSLLTTETLSGPVTGKVSYTYDTNFRIATETVNGSAPVSLQYDADSLLVQAGLLVLTRSGMNGLIESTELGQITNRWIYNSFSEIISSSAIFRDASLYGVELTRDRAGRIIQKVETIGGVTNQHDYGYDLGDRLATVMKNGATVSTYTYDNNNNRLTFMGLGGGSDATFDDQDRLTQYGTKIYDYTPNGELKTRNAAGQVTSYQYDTLGNLVAVVLPDATRIDYLIDGLNRRIGKKINGTLAQGFLFVGPLRCLAELDGAGNLVSRFVYATRRNVPDYMIKGAATYRIITDYLGSPQLVVDVATGTVVQRIEFDEFGNVIADTSPGFQPFGFAGGLYDRDSKLVRFGARDYDPETGRWTAKDPSLFGGGDANLYAYSLNDPVNNIDNQGAEPQKSGYDTELDAWMAAAADAYLSTARTGWEYGGELYKQDNKYFYNIRTDKDPGSVSVGRRNCPAGSDPLSTFHSHPPDFKHYRPQRFSKEDKSLSFSEGLNDLLITPLGTLLIYSPNTQQTTSLGNFTF
ncbi:MAG: hypothetical protein DME18_12835, partial [Verrucomicrobia bacterium]